MYPREQDGLPGLTIHKSWKKLCGGRGRSDEGYLGYFYYNVLFYWDGSTMTCMKSFHLLEYIWSPATNSRVWNWEKQCLSCGVIRSDILTYPLYDFYMGKNSSLPGRIITDGWSLSWVWIVWQTFFFRNTLSLLWGMVILMGCTTIVLGWVGHPWCSW